MRTYVSMLYNKHGVLRAMLEPCTKANTNEENKRRVNRRGHYIATGRRKEKQGTYLGNMNRGSRGQLNIPGEGGDTMK